MRNLKRVLSLVLALMMALSLMAFTGSASAAESTTISVAADKYSDYDQATPAYKEAVDVVTALEIIQGVKAGSGETLSPDVTLDRAQATAILARMMLGVEQAETMDGVNASTGFSDVANDHYAANYIAYCANQGIISGTGAGTFLPAEKLSGVAFGKMLLVALGYNAEKEGLTGNNWTTNVAVTLANAGIELRDGDGNLVDLTKDLNREQAMEMTFQALQTPLVEYPTMTLSQSAIATKNGASFVTSTLASADNISTKTLTASTILSSPKLVEFAEKYFQKLKLNDTVDAFGRPTHTWLLNNITVGTYDDFDLLIAEYNSEVNDVVVSGHLAGYYIPLNDPTESAVIGNTKVVPATTYTKYGGSDGAIGANGVITATDLLNNKHILYENSAKPKALNLGSTDESGAKVSSTIAKTIADQTGNGTKVEIYVDKDYENIISNIVVIHYAVGTLNVTIPVSKDRTNYAVTNAKWSGDGDAAKALGTNATTVTKSDFDDPNVADTINYDKFTEEPKTGDIVTCAVVDQKLYIYPTKQISGVQESRDTKPQTETRDTYEVTISGEPYILGTAVGGVDETDFSNSKSSANYYLDQYDKVVYSDKTHLDYAYIVAAGGGVRPGPEGNVPNLVVRAVLVEDGKATANEYNLAVEKKNGTWYIKGTTYEIDVTSDETARNAAEKWLTTTYSVLNTYEASKDWDANKNPYAGYTVWDYSVDGGTITLYEMKTVEGNKGVPGTGDANKAYKGNVYVGTATTDITNGTTKVTVVGTAENANKVTDLYLNNETTFIIYNAATQTASIVNGNTSLGNTTLKNAKIVAVANGTNTVVSYLVFGTINQKETTTIRTDYVYINYEKGSTQTSGGTVYTGYTPGGEKIPVTDATGGINGTGQKIVDMSGIYTYNTDTNIITEKNATAFRGTSTYLQGDKINLIATNLIDVNPTIYGKTPINLSVENAVYVDVEKGHEDGNYAFIVVDNNNTNKVIFIVPKPTSADNRGNVNKIEVDYGKDVSSGEKNTAFGGNGFNEYTVTTNAATACPGEWITLTVTCSKKVKDGGAEKITFTIPGVTTDDFADGTKFDTGKPYIVVNSDAAKGDVVGTITFTMPGGKVTINTDAVDIDAYVLAPTTAQDITDALKNENTVTISTIPTGTVTIPANKTVVLTGGTLDTDSTFEGDGTVSVAGGTSGSPTALTISGGSIKTAVSIPAHASVTVSGGTVSGDVTVAKDGGLTVSGGTVSGKVDVAENATLTVSSSGSTVSGEVTVDGTLNLTGTLTNSGTMTINNEVEGNGSITNKGTIEFAEGIINLPTITNEGSGKVTIVGKTAEPDTRYKAGYTEAGFKLEGSNGAYTLAGDTAVMKTFIEKYAKTDGTSTGIGYTDSATDLLGLLRGTSNNSAINFGFTVDAPQVGNTSATSATIIKRSRTGETETSEWQAGDDLVDGKLHLYLGIGQLYKTSGSSQTEVENGDSTAASAITGVGVVDGRANTTFTYEITWKFGDGQPTVTQKLTVETDIANAESVQTVTPPATSTPSQNDEKAESN